MKTQYEKKKKATQKLFDITTVNVFGDKTCKILGLFLLKKMAYEFDKKYSRFYCDGLICLKNSNNGKSW